MHISTRGLDLSFLVDIISHLLDFNIKMHPKSMQKWQSMIFDAYYNIHDKTFIADHAAKK